MWNWDISGCTAEVDDCRYREKEVCEGGKVKIRISNVTLELLTYFMLNLHWTQESLPALLGHNSNIDMYFFQTMDKIKT